jgi:probable rRNA maturation factor
LGSPEAELSIVIVNDPQIAELNQLYLNRQGPTNVIAFPLQQGEFTEFAGQMLGDVVISVDTAMRESEAAGLDFQQRFDQLLIHGILHLFGYDHVTNADDARLMDEKSEQLLALISKL